MNISRGFTLIELMIVVAVVGVLTAIAYPSYQAQMQKSRRADGLTMLTRIMQAQERFYTLNNRYTVSLGTDLSYDADANQDVTSEEGFYLIDAAACAGSTIANCVILTATPQGGQAPDGPLTLNSRGAKTPADKW
jgi:type IV pilus assembly protein PilE